MASSWLDLLGAGLGGGLIVKALDYLYQEYRLRSEARKSATDLIDRHIDPILKSADELVGKLRSLAQSDFRAIIKAPVPEDSEFEKWLPYLDIIYLFAQFWSRIQILRIEGTFVNFSTDGRGKQLLDFFRALEGTRTRIVSRAWQRGIGEALLERTNNGYRNINYIEFVQRFLSQNGYRRWFNPLISVLSRIKHTREKQRLLTYGVIINALIDTLDPGHLVTRDRPGWPNKLTNKSRKNLKYRLFKIYLPFVKNQSRYYMVSKNGSENTTGKK
ncbi:MAG: hypothetical protein JRJ77_11770 [Deltaproteobacteria bacterium]|nr:hypothetical protein [Deltaproteobacteria bacterium]MBW1796647.1 hypothetical protein [Deltaproteobacteria bacterium]